LPQLTSADRPFVVAKSLPGLDHAAKAVANAICPNQVHRLPQITACPLGLDHCFSTGVGEAFHHTPCVHMSIYVSFRLYKKNKKKIKK
jgi:hypothetical protein